MPGRGNKLAALLVSASLSFIPAAFAQNPAPAQPSAAPATTAPATPAPPTAVPADPGIDVTVVGPKAAVAEPAQPEAEAPHVIGTAPKPAATISPDKSGNNAKPGAAKAPKAGSPADSGTMDSGSRYVLGPNDVVQVQVYGDRGLTSFYSIGPDSMMSMPLINEFKASGLTLPELKELISKKLEDFINDPEVSVSLAKSNSKKYTLVGGVLRSGPIPLVQETTILDALSAAGFREFAKPNKTYLLRGGKKIPFKYNEVIAGKNMKQNIAIQDGDIIYVPGE